MSFDKKPYESKMQKTIEVLESEFATIRVGRASARVLDKITVSYYGSPTGIDGVATVKTPDARTLLIQPWETSMLKEIEKAIAASDLGITPQNDGKAIRLNTGDIVTIKKSTLETKLVRLKNRSFYDVINTKFKEA